MPEDTLTVTPQTNSVPPKRNHRINYGLAATLLANGEDLLTVCSKVGAKNPNTLKVGLFRRGVTMSAARVLKSVNAGTCSLTLKIASQASELLRKDLGETLQAHANALKQIPAKPNLKQLKALTEVIEPMARTGKILHDWGNESATGLAMVGLYDQQDSNTALDVPASVTSQDQTTTTSPYNSSVSLPNTDQSQ